MPYVSGEQAAELTGQPQATVDAAAAQGLIPAQYGNAEGNSWMLMVDPSAYTPHPSVRTNEIQHIKIQSDGVTEMSGTFRLEFKGAWTRDIAYNPSALILGKSLMVLPTIGPGNLIVTQPDTGGYDVKYVNALGSQDVPLLGWDESKLVGGTVQITVLIEGIGTGPEPPAKKRAPRKTTKRAAPRKSKAKTKTKE